MKELTITEINNLSENCKKAKDFFDNDPNPRYVGDYSSPNNDQELNREILKNAGIMYFGGSLYWLD